MMGATTPCVVKALDQLHFSGRDLAQTGPSSCGPLLGWLYGWNTLGGALGALTAVFLLPPTLGLGSTLWLVATIGWVVALCAGVLGMQTPSAPAGSPPKQQLSL